MSLNLLRNHVSYRPLHSLVVASRGYCENKSIYQQDEEGPQPRKVHGKLYPDWRKSWISREGEWYSKLSVFVRKNPNPEMLKTMQRLPDFSYQDFKNFWKFLKERHEIDNQKYISRRVEVLGSDLAAIHFFTYKGCCVRLQESTTWLKGDPTRNLVLPHKIEPGWNVEAIDCHEFIGQGIRYEGISNLLGLNHLKWLSFKDNKHVDVWCLDRLAGQNGETLEYLDISGCSICVGCTIALCHMPYLKILIITDPVGNPELQAGFSYLEQQNPNLLIRAL